MKKRYFLLILVSNCLFGQYVGIGTDQPNAVLHVKSSASTTKADGFKLPSLTLEQLTAKGENVYTTEHRGTMIYISNTSSGNTLGQRANINGIGHYYFDGSFWNKIQKDISLYTTNSKLTGDRKVNLDGKTLSFDNVSGSGNTNQFSIDNNTFTINTSNKTVGVGNSNSNTKLDVRTTTNSNNDPGNGYIGIGTTTTAANVAGAGAMRYHIDEFNNGGLQFSNGVVWNTMESEVEKVVLIARKNAAQTIPNNSETIVTNWQKITDNVNAFNQNTGVFTVPRTGNYIVSYSLSFVDAQIPANTYVEISIKSSTSTNTQKSRVVYTRAGNSQTASYMTKTLKLTEGEQISCAAYQNSGNNIALRVEPSGVGNGAGFVNFSVVEM